MILYKKKGKNKMINNIKERLAKLNSALFNGHNRAQVIQIYLERTHNLSFVKYSDHFKRFIINFDFGSTIISKGDEISSLVDRNRFNYNLLKYSEVECDEEYITLRARHMQLKLTDMTSILIKGSYPRNSDINIIYNNDSGKYKAKLITTITFPMTDDLIKYYNATSGLLTRQFEQCIEFDEKVKSILLVYPNMNTIPVLFAYDTEDIDFNKLFDKDNADYFYTSFDQQFTIKETIQFNTQENKLSLDHNFAKAESVIRTMDENIIETIDENGDILYKYEYKDFVGSYYESGKDAQFFLKGEKQNYMVYGYKENYGLNVFEFLDTLKKYIDNDSTNIDTEKDFNTGYELLKSIMTNNFLRNYIRMYPIENIKIFKENCGVNKNTFTYYIDDDIHGMIKVITIYNGEYVAIHEYQKHESHPICIISFIKISKDTKESDTLISSVVELEDDDQYTYFKYYTYLCNKYYTNGLVKQIKKDINDCVDSEVIKSVEYQAPDVENLHYQTYYINEGGTKELITKLDSLIYENTNLSKILIRNYLGFPVNYNYI